MRSLIGITCLALVLVVLLGCQSAGEADVAAPTAVDANPMRAVTFSRQPMAEREPMVDQMLADDAAAFWQDAAAVTRQIDDWPMIRLLCDKATASKDARALPWLVRSWAMASKTVDDVDRPERKAIESILGRPAPRVLTEIVFDPDKPDDLDDAATELAAWTVLTRTVPDRRLRMLLDDADEADASLLVSMLKGLAPAVDVLPGDRIAVGQLLYLAVRHDDEQIKEWSRFRESQAGKGPPGLALRHLPAITQRDVTRDDWTWGRWLEHVKERLADRRHVTRGDGAEESVVVRVLPDRFLDHAERLGIADMIVIDHMLDAMAEPSVVREFFVQARADQLDTTTEYGGALVWNEQGALAYRAFDPLLRRHDQAYYASTLCMHAVYTGLAHVHFHTQRYDNAPWAGPGQGDLDFARAQHVNCIVLTYVDPDTLNVDVYFPSGVVIDLGCVTR